MVEHNMNTDDRHYDRHTTETLSDVADYMDRLNDRMRAMGHDINRCESHKINTNGYVCIFDGVVQITMQNNITGIGVQMWLCQSCFNQIHAQWRAKNPDGEYRNESGN